MTAKTLFGSFIKPISSDSAFIIIIIIIVVVVVIITAVSLEGGYVEIAMDSI
jgi:hypothetical protein